MTGPTSPRVVALCGSIRFVGEFRRVERDLALTGAIVLSPAFPIAGDPEPSQEQITNLKRRHNAAIDMADDVIVICPGGYVGESTGAEVAHAERAGKPVSYLDPLVGARLDEMGVAP